MGTDSGILTATQRKELQDGSRDERRDVQERVRNALTRDALVLWENLDSEERRRVLQTRDHERKERGESGTEQAEKLHLESGIAAFLALLYAGLEDRNPGQGGKDFETILHNAMDRIAGRNGWTVDEFEFIVKFDREPDAEKLRTRFDEGTATVEEATELYQNDVITSGEYASYVQNG